MPSKEENTIEALLRYVSSKEKIQKPEWQMLGITYKSLQTEFRKAEELSIKNATALYNRLWYASTNELNNEINKILDNTCWNDYRSREVVGQLINNKLYIDIETGNIIFNNINIDNLCRTGFYVKPEYISTLYNNGFRISPNTCSDKNIVFHSDFFLSTYINVSEEKLSQLLDKYGIAKDAKALITDTEELDKGKNILISRL